MNTSTAAHHTDEGSCRVHSGRDADAAMLARAVSDYAAIRRRRRLLGSYLSSDPAWSMLLDLFISGCSGRRLSVSALCIGSQCPHSTALRYESLLANAGLVERMADATDARRSFVQLTNEGWRAMRELLTV